MTDPTNPATARAALARRATLPWWLLAVQGLGLLALFGAPAFAELVPSPWTASAVMWFGVIAVVGIEMLLQRTRGVVLSRRSMLAYPSTRRAGLGLLAVGIVGTLVSSLLVRAEQLTPALVVVVIAAAAGTVLLWRLNRGLQRDIRDGRARP